MSEVTLLLVVGKLVGGFGNFQMCIVMVSWNGDTHMCVCIDA